MLHKPPPVITLGTVSFQVDTLVIITEPGEQYHQFGKIAPGWADDTCFRIDLFNGWDNSYGARRALIAPEWVQEALPYIIAHATEIDPITVRQIKQELQCCEEEGCFQLSANQTHGERLSVYLEGRDGNGDPNEVFLHCWRHCSPVAKKLLKTVEVTNLTPDKYYWTKMATWQHPNGFWYGRGIRLENDSTYEYSGSDYESGTQTFGPFTTRAEAAAKIPALRTKQRWRLCQKCYDKHSYFGNVKQQMTRKTGSNQSCDACSERWVIVEVLRAW